MKVLVTGGAGYIGSHTVAELVEAGFEPIVVDNFCNSSQSVMQRLRRICGREIPLIMADVRSRDAMDAVFDQVRPAAVIHFAGLKSVAESVSDPLRYYDFNVGGTLTLLGAMKRSRCQRLVFSSSATVYGVPSRLPVTECEPLKPANPYGHSKAIAEQIIADFAAANAGFRAISLRYFNPVGAHPSALIGEDPRGTPNNLMPFLSQVAIGRRPYLEVFGIDYPTPDGTGVRDYIHVVDLAVGHVAAIRGLDLLQGSTTINLGSGKGYSVLEMIDHFRVASGRDICWRAVGRRPGDVSAYYADATRAIDVLGWRPKRGPEAMCADGWRWQVQNPTGYDSEG